MAAKSATTAPTPRFEERQRLMVVLQLATEVREDGVHVRLRPIPGTGRHVRFDEIEAVEVATYDASEHGGWHWGFRVSPGGDAAYRASGSEGVRLRLTDGRTVFLGSRRPRELLEEIEAGIAGG